jgi:hypothetical protein
MTTIATTSARANRAGAASFTRLPRPAKVI